MINNFWSQLLRRVKFFFKTLLQAFANPLLVLLIGTFIITTILDIAFNSFSIFEFIVLSGIIAATIGLEFWQIVRTKNLLAQVRKNDSYSLLVVREHQVTPTPIDQVIPGDEFLVRTGDIIPVRGVVTAANDLIVDEQEITGSETLTVKQPFSAGRKIQSQLLVGSRVVQGHGRAQIELASMSLVDLLKSGYVMRRLSRKLTIYTGCFGFLIGGLIAGLLFWLAPPKNIAIVNDYSLIIISLVVGIIPESVLLIIHLALARNLKHFYSRISHVLHPELILQVGFCDVYCFDQSGVLTVRTDQKEMIDPQVWSCWWALYQAGYQTKLLTHSGIKNNIIQRLQSEFTNLAVTTMAELKLNYRHLNQFDVVCNCSFGDKVKLVQLLRRRSQVVCIGSRITDLTQFRYANVGISPSTAPTMVQQFTDINLKGQRFAYLKRFLVHANHFSRMVQQLISFILVCNLLEVILMTFGVIWQKQSLFSPSTILWFNFTTEFWIGIVLALRNLDDQHLPPPPVRWWITIIGLVIPEGFLIAIGVILVGVIMNQVGISLDEIKCFMFLCLLFIPLLYAFLISDINWYRFPSIGLCHRFPVLIYSVVMIGVLNLIIALVPFIGQPLFQINYHHLFWFLGCAIGVVLTTIGWMLAWRCGVQRVVKFCHPNRFIKDNFR